MNENDVLIDINAVSKLLGCHKNTIWKMRDPSYFLLDKSVSTEYLHDYLLKNYHQIVIKIDSLAKGKGVFVQGDHFNSIDDGIILLNTELVNEKIVIEEKLNYIDAICFYCENNDLEVESVTKLISKPLKERLKWDAIRLNFMKKTSRAKLPL